MMNKTNTHELKILHFDQKKEQITQQEQQKIKQGENLVKAIFLLERRLGKPLDMIKVTSDLVEISEYIKDFAPAGIQNKLLDAAADTLRTGIRFSAAETDKNH